MDDDRDAHRLGRGRGGGGARRVASLRRNLLTGVLTVQLERPGSGWLELSPRALGGYADALARSWSALGVAEDDRVVIWDYGSSPVAYLASQAFAPYLERGAAELTSSLALCVDGLPDNAGRVAHVLRHYRPRFLFTRADLVPLLVYGPTAVAESERTATLVVTADGDTPARGERLGWERAWPGGVALVARCDAAAFLAPECPTCSHLRVAGDLYETRAAVAAEGNGGPLPLTVRPRFLDRGPVATEIRARRAERADCCGDDDRFHAL